MPVIHDNGVVLEDSLTTYKLCVDTIGNHYSGNFGMNVWYSYTISGLGNGGSYGYGAANGFILIATYANASCSFGVFNIGTLVFPTNSIYNVAMILEVWNTTDITLDNAIANGAKVAYSKVFYQPIDNIFGGDGPTHLSYATGGLQSYDLVMKTLVPVGLPQTPSMTLLGIG